MIYRKPAGAFGLQPKKTTAPPWSAGALPRKGELDTADRRLRELEQEFGEEETAGRRDGSGASATR